MLGHDPWQVRSAHVAPLDDAARERVLACFARFPRADHDAIVREVANAIDDYHATVRAGLNAIPQPRDRTLAEIESLEPILASLEAALAKLSPEARARVAEKYGRGELSDPMFAAQSLRAAVSTARNEAREEERRPGRPPKQAERLLLHDLARIWKDTTGRTPPRGAKRQPNGSAPPFVRFAEAVFAAAGIAASPMKLTQRTPRNPA